MATEDLLSNTVFSGFLLILAGFSLALQSGNNLHMLIFFFIYKRIIGCNATLTRYGGRSFSSVMSFSSGVLCCLIFFGVDIGALGTPLPTAVLESNNEICLKYKY